MSKVAEIRDIHKSYKSGSQQLEILTGLSLDIDEGEMAAITGVSGSGKSTLLHLLEEWTARIAGRSGYSTARSRV